MTTYVSDFTQLREAIEDGETTEIVVQNDITFLSGGAKVNTSKGELVIDFGGHSVTDINSLNFSDTIHVSTGAPQMSITVKNVNWSGHNYYGMIGVYDGNSLISLNFENITYKGPQCVYNRSGSTRLVDATITIDKNESGSNVQEFCETNRLSVGGSVIVNSNTTSNSVMLFTGANSSIVVEEGAYFEVNALSTYLLFVDSSIALLFKKNSKTFIITKNGLFYGAGNSSHIASSFSLEENAIFSATRNAANSVPMLKLMSNMTIGKNASLSLYSPSVGTSALIYFGAAANMIVSDPHSVVLYNNGGNVFAFNAGSESTPNIVMIDSEMLRLWNKATTPLESAGGLDDVPNFEYHKLDYSSNLNVTLKATKTAIIGADCNLEEQDIGYPIDTSVPVLASKVVAIGRFDLLVNAPTDISTSVVGSTRSAANVRVEYLNKQSSTTSSGSGAFLCSIEDRLPIGTNVSVFAGRDFLSKQLVVQSTGSVSLTKIEPLAFRAFPQTPRRDKILRVDENWELEVTDTRQSGGDWHLYAHINSPLSSDGENLSNALAFCQSGKTTLLSNTPTLIYSGTWKEGENLTKISWKSTEGFLLLIDSQKDYVAGNYSTNIEWQITDSPL